MESLCKKKSILLVRTNGRKLFINKNYQKKIFFFKKVNNMKDFEIGSLSTTETIYLLKTKGPNHKAFYKKGKRNFGNYYTKITFYWISILFMFQNAKFRFNAFYLIVSILALSNSYIFYSFQLVELIVNKLKPIFIK